MNQAMQSRLYTLERVTVLDLKGDMSLSAGNRLAMRDIADGLRLWHLAWTLAWLDIRLRYRGSMLGPFWLTLSTAIMVGSLGVLYATLFHMDVHDYLPFLALSQVLWAFLSTLVIEACTCFTQAEGMIRAVRMPLFLHALRMLIRNVLVLAHNVVVIVVVDIVFSIQPGWHAILALPAFAVWGVDALAVALLLGSVLCAFPRYRANHRQCDDDRVLSDAGDLATATARAARRAAAVQSVLCTARDRARTVAWTNAVV